MKLRMALRLDDNRLEWPRAAARLLLALIGLAVPAAHAQQVAISETTQTIASRPGVTESFYLDTPPTQPSAALILLAGGDGVVGVRNPPPALAPDPQGSGNFLVRSRQLFASHGLLVLVLDTPSDHPDGVNGYFRAHGESVQDIQAVLDWLHQRYALPVWLVGTSRGTESAANAAIHLGDRLAGLVLTSTITTANRQDGFPVSSMALGRIRVPTLALGHVDDLCELSRPAGEGQVIAELGAPVKQALLLSGGGSPRGAVCGAQAHHGFIGQEAEAVAVIADFIAAAGRRPQ